VDLTIEELEHVLDDAALWGLELDTRYRVLAATFEPIPERHPEGEVEDRRIQVLMYPVSTILASLREQVDGRTVVRRFTAEQLLDVVSALDGATVTSPIFGRPEPRPGEWAPEWSLEGRSMSADGVTRTFAVRVTRDGLTLDLFARFDEAEVNRAVDAVAAEEARSNGE
jgi:hypothetical protein